MASFACRTLCALLKQRLQKVLQKDLPCEMSCLTVVHLACVTLQLAMWVILQPNWQCGLSRNPFIDADPIINVAYPLTQSSNWFVLQPNWLFLIPQPNHRHGFFCNPLGTVAYQQPNHRCRLTLNPIIDVAYPAAQLAMWLILQHFQQLLPGVGAKGSSLGSRTEVPNRFSCALRAWGLGPKTWHGYLCNSRWGVHRPYAPRLPEGCS